MTYDLDEYTDLAMMVDLVDRVMHTLSLLSFRMDIKTILAVQAIFQFVTDLIRFPHPGAVTE